MCEVKTLPDESLAPLRLDPVRNRRFDIVVIGGGIAGAGALRDAALRQFSVALFEREDYGSGGTSFSSRLIDSGLDCFGNGGFRQIRDEFRERDTLLRIAPDLVKPVECLVPFRDLMLYRLWKGRAMMRMLASSGRRILSDSELLREEPCVRPGGLEGGLIYQDALLESPERLTVANITDARSLGAVALNHVEAAQFRSDPAGTAIHVRDLLAGDEAEVRARVVIDATSSTGPLNWFRCAMPAFTQRAICVFSRTGRRLFQSAPVVGIAYSSHAGGGLEELLETAAALLPDTAAAPVYWTALEPERPAPLRAYPGPVRMECGKPGTYRLRAERAVDAAVRRLGSQARCTTAERVLPGDECGDLERQVNRAVGQEQCLFLDDFMRRRSTLSLGEDQGLGSSSQVARSMAQLLGWSAGRMEAELIHYRQWVLRTREPMRRHPIQVRNTAAGG